VVTGSFFLSGLAWSASAGWINFGDGTPTNGHTYSNTDGADFGVNHDGEGRLSGLAWGAGIGWINFGWAPPEDVNAPRLDLATGYFSGLAWSSTTGWIQLGTGQLRTLSLFDADNDTDGVSDAWEWKWFGNLSSAHATSDADHDGFSDLAEHQALTHPLLAADHFRILESHLTGERLSITFTSRPGRHYRLFLSTDLQGWEDSEHGLFTPDTGSSTTRLVRQPSPMQGFIRVQALKPLTP
jgi:hypothetical protein